MKETARTLGFVGVALALAGAAWFVHARSQPNLLEDFAKVGSEFYPDFTDPADAGALEIWDYDKTTKQTLKFQVEFDRGRWRIPSRYGYPADAKDRLEKAATSLMGIKRKSLAARQANAHRRLGVVAPPEISAANSETDSDSLEGIGQRIVLKDKYGNVLADYLLGKKVANQPNLYFIRIPKEQATYRADLELEVSTNFSDWVEKDLLNLDQKQVLSLELGIPVYRMLNNKKLLLNWNFLKLTHKNGHIRAPWGVEGIDPKTEEANTVGIQTILNTLDALELVDVRPKLPGLAGDLSFDLDQIPLGEDPTDVLRRLQTQLGRLGFQLTPSLENGPKEKYFISGDAGALLVKTEEGLVYKLHFGNPGKGNKSEIQVGKTEVADEEGNTVADRPTGKTPALAKTLNPRYLFIHVEFDQSLLGKPLVKPTPPEKPAGLKDNSQPDAEQARLQKEYDSQMLNYRHDLAIHDEKQKQVAAAKTKVGQLNQRFGKWYYVISAESFAKLTFNREAVVKAKKPVKPMSDPDISPREGSIQKPAIAEKPPKN